MTAVLKGYIAAPVGTERKMAGLQLLPTSNIHNGGPTTRVDELSELSGLIAREEDEYEDRDTDTEYHMVQKEEAADMPPNFPRSVSGHGCRSYGATSSPAAVKRRRRRQARKHSRPHSRGSSGFLSPQPHLYSLQPHALRQDHEYNHLNHLHEQHRRFYSTTAIPQEYDRLLADDETTDDDDDTDNRHSDPSSDEEDPPIMELIYRRTCKDKLKLIIIPLLYFLFFVMAGVFAFYSIEALIESYNHRVRTASYVTVDNYSPVGIALFLQDFSTYENCQFKYGDDLSPYASNWSSLNPVPTDNCSTSVNITFNSTLIGQNRTAMVFKGPTRVNLKQSLWLNFSMNTTKRQFGAMEFLMLSSWWNLMKMSKSERSSYLALQETKEPLYTVPSGFRSWVKMYYIIRNDGATQTNLSEFYINTDFSKYNDQRPLENRTTDPLVVLFEWKSPTYEYISDILSTTIWNTVGSLAGVFVTLIKAGEYFYAWIKRIRRERRKKLLKLQEIEEERQRMIEEHERRKEERKKLKQLASNSQENLIVN